MFHEVEMFAANWLIRNRLRSTEFNRNQQVLESGSGPGVGDEATTSGVTSKPANGGHFKTGQRKWPGTRLFYSDAS